MSIPPEVLPVRLAVWPPPLTRRVSWGMSAPSSPRILRGSLYVGQPMDGPHSVGGRLTTVSGPPMSPRVRVVRVGSFSAAGGPPQSKFSGCDALQESLDFHLRDLQSTVKHLVSMATEQIEQSAHHITERMEHQIVRCASFAMLPPVPTPPPTVDASRQKLEKAPEVTTCASGLISEDSLPNDGRDEQMMELRQQLAEVKRTLESDNIERKNAVSMTEQLSTVATLHEEMKVLRSLLQNSSEAVDTLRAEADATAESWASLRAQLDTLATKLEATPSQDIKPFEAKLAATEERVEKLLKHSYRIMLVDLAKAERKLESVCAGTPGQLAEEVMRLHTKVENNEIDVNNHLQEAKRSAQELGEIVLTETAAFKGEMEYLEFRVDQEISARESACTDIWHSFESAVKQISTHIGLELEPFGQSTPPPVVQRRVLGSQHLPLSPIPAPSLKEGDETAIPIANGGER